jgi:hypothetical protein
MLLFFFTASFLFTAFLPSTLFPPLHIISLYQSPISPIINLINKYPRTTSIMTDDSRLISDLTPTPTRRDANRLPRSPEVDKIIKEQIEQGKRGSFSKLPLAPSAHPPGSVPSPTSVGGVHPAHSGHVQGPGVSANGHALPHSQSGAISYSSAAAAAAAASGSNGGGYPSGGGYGGGTYGGSVTLISPSISSSRSTTSASVVSGSNSGTPMPLSPEDEDKDMESEEES